RHPDAKWRLRPAQLARRTAEQDAILEKAAAFVGPGGRLLYVTCSVLRVENEERVTGFLQAHPQFSVTAPPIAGAFATGDGFLRLSPASSDTDGFFVAVLERSPGKG
ncbi:MAG: MFS transporter, partial [Candidatus Dormibacteria bacterium]